MRHLLFFACVALLTCITAQARAADRPGIGSKAPGIEIERWFHEKKSATEFEAGKVSVIEFWATWCGPCIISIPHQRDIQKQHADALTVISVSDESPEIIKAFLERERDDLPPSMTPFFKLGFCLLTLPPT
jgi:thiol-disulfide isomerase/thioredoxin